VSASRSCVPASGCPGVKSSEFNSGMTRRNAAREILSLKRRPESGTFQNLRFGSCDFRRNGHCRREYEFGCSAKPLQPRERRYGHFTVLKHFPYGCVPRPRCEGDFSSRKIHSGQQSVAPGNCNGQRVKRFSMPASIPQIRGYVDSSIYCAAAGGTRRVASAPTEAIDCGNCVGSGFCASEPLGKPHAAIAWHQAV
jgi:hypothetical protein